MAYAIAGLAHETNYKPPGYPTTHAFLPHGVSVVLSAPAVVRRTASADPARHLKVAELLGADVRSANSEDAGELLSQRLVALMRRLATPNGTAGVGATESHLPALVAGTLAQTRLLANAPILSNEAELIELFNAGLSCW
jgi:alcohol dehydrogenase class IV